MVKSFQFPGGFIEATANVRDAQACAKSLCEIAGWELFNSGELDPALLTGWGLDAAARGHYLLLRNPGDDRGYLRVQQLSGVDQQATRPSPQTWDTGAIIDLNVRVLDLDDDG